ncbi:type IV secretion system protein VirB10, partial [Klebsiella pneumoniae]|nr:type IV secretion system protein VirB10 [Klebsiella pneumoniae]
MSEQENKTLTAVEIERELRERRQKELEQADKTDKEEDSGRPANSLGIEKLKKSRKGLIIIVAAFVLLAAGVSVYYVPSIIRSMSSNDEKPASSDVATGSVKRQTGLSDDVDPFNSDQKTQGGQEEKKGDNNSGKAEAAPESVQHNFSRALDVSYGGSSSAASGGSGSASTQTASETKGGGNTSTTQ